MPFEPGSPWPKFRGNAVQDGASYASLTCACVCSLAICLHALGTKDVRSDAGIKKGLAWLDRNLDPERYEMTFVGRAPARFERIGGAWECQLLPPEEHPLAPGIR